MTTLKVPAVVAHRHGGPDVLEFTDIEVAEPGPGELRIVQQAIGLNFADVYQRKGAAGPHATTQFPVVLGSQGAGVVESIGDGVTDFKPGDLVAYVHRGTYAGALLVPAARTVPLAAELDVETAAATLLRGMTAEYLLHRLYPVRAGERILVHAAAGGMGQILCSWARALGAEVIGTVGSAAKRAVALAAGCHHVIDYRAENLV
ncbi:MAG TPA: alcohol dehydrogenase catalytic domain-containing protein, partial [Bradyrhizobium sp.]|nr:alcohol dehydrogenase catalytic domain-containing protein [Bradyrhizobium sp.]